MKHIYLNLKRFDISPDKGGVNRLAPVKDWGRAIVRATEDGLKKYTSMDVEFVQFLPEAHLLAAAGACGENSPIRLGCQGVYRKDTEPGGNFGAFTTNRTANAARELGCSHVLIGHCEERQDKLEILKAAGVEEETANQTVNKLLNQEIKAALAAGLSVLYCIGEEAAQRGHWQQVLRAQIEEGLDGAKKQADANGQADAKGQANVKGQADTGAPHLAIAYEPVWSIGPGKKPAAQADIAQAAAYIKELTGGIPVVYGGGLKKDNARMLAQIPDIDGGLIALTRFTGEIGFYPDEYLEIIKEYLGG